MKILTLFLGMLSCQAFAQSPVKTSNVSEMVRIYCEGCHTKDKQSLEPIIHGQKKLYIIKQMYDFKVKNRLHPKMSDVAEKFSNDEIQDIADFLSQQEFKK
jgi:cytochrome c553